MGKRKITVGWATNNKTTAHDRESFKGVLNNEERNEGVLLARNEKDPEKKKWLKSRQPAPMWNVDGCKDNIRSKRYPWPLLLHRLRPQGQSQDGRHSCVLYGTHLSAS